MVKGIGRRISAVAGDENRQDGGGCLSPCSLFSNQLMATAERTFLLPCTCSARVSVTAGQAGGRTACAACGREIDVPRLRDLSIYAVDQPPTEVATRSGLGRGLVVAGCAVAIGAAVLGSSLVPIGGLFFPQPATVTEIRAAVAAAAPTDVHSAWQSIARSGVARPATREELRLQQFAANVAGVANLLWGISSIGLVVAVAGAVIAASGRSAGGGTSR